MAFCVIGIVAICLGFNVVSAGAGDTNVSTFGIEETASLSRVADNGSVESVTEVSAEETPLLTKTASRNINKAVDEMLAEEEAERKAAEEARLAAEAATRARLTTLQNRSQNDAALLGIASVDWLAGHDAFVAEWTARLNTYLAGSALASQGATFAEAAWNYGVDPRLSPAISNTESSKGAICFLSHNAWGWGDSSWSTWEQAIDAHVQGLSKGGYAPMMTYADAQRYCPPNYDHWYKSTVTEMARM